MRAALPSTGLLLATLLAAPVASADPSVWIVDDGEKIRGDALATPFERGTDNPLWRPGEPARLFAMRNESVAFQVVVETDGDSLDGVAVDFEELDGPDGKKISDQGLSPYFVGRPIERFVEHFVDVRRASGGKTPAESLGWEPGSGPSPDTWVGPVPDALIPVERAPVWDPYPLKLEPRANGIVWIDVNVPRDQAPGVYQGQVAVHVGDRSLAKLPVELEVVDAILPDRTVGTALYYDHEELEKRVGGQAEQNLWQILHAHRIAPLHDAVSPQDVDRQVPALTGALYTRTFGYVGPAQATGDGLLTLGAYGAFRGPDEPTLARVQDIVHRVGDQKLFGSTELVLYAADEECSSPWGAGWRRLLQSSGDPDLHRVRVGWTCSLDPTAQPVDVPMLHAAFDPTQVAAAQRQGKETWVYNGVLPHTGTFLLDADAVSPRVNGWLSAMFRVPRWFYWESTHWYADHGETPVDPFEEAETFHNDDGDWANGDGILLYPGTQRDAFAEHSAGVDGVFPSIRLKNWRRGIEDAGYLQMARARDAERADAVARWLVPAAFGEARSGETPSWSSRGKAFFDARRALLAIALGREPVALEKRPEPVRAVALPAGCSHGTTEAASGVALALVGAVGLGRLRRRRVRA